MSVEASQVVGEATKRRTIAVISHPDAGKSTLTEAMLLHAEAISEAGAVHGKAGRRGTVSDWMEMEKSRGISISSAAIQFSYGDVVINLVDTPGHSDFSEDTFRVLAAVDAAIMLVDAAKGLEAQTMKLFDVCRSRGIPIVTMINKWDRPGLDALDLVDEIRNHTGMTPMPINWPVGDAGFLRGLLDVSTGHMLRFTRTPGGAQVATSEHLTPAVAEEQFGDEWRTAAEDVSLLGIDGHAMVIESFLSQQGTPLLFGAAVHNIGVHELLNFIATAAPSPGARMASDTRTRPVEADFSAYVFKVQSGMDPAHRDRLAFIRICSGVFDRGMVVYHAQTGRPFPTKYAQHIFGRDRETVDLAWPGDVVGLVNAHALRPGDTLYVGQPVMYPGLPRFAPEHFRIATAADSSKHKQFRRGIEQLDQEGVVQVLRSERRGDQSPILGAVGPMQFEVAEQRLGSEFGAPIRLATLDYTIACATDKESARALISRRDCEVVSRSNGGLLALFSSPWPLRRLMSEMPDLVLDPLSGVVDFPHHTSHSVTS